MSIRDRQLVTALRAQRRQYRTDARHLASFVWMGDELRLTASLTLVLPDSTTIILAANTRAVAWAGATLDRLRSHFVSFTLPDDHTLYLCRQEDWAAISAAQDVLPVAYHTLRQSVPYVPRGGPLPDVALIMGLRLLGAPALTPGRYGTARRPVLPYPAAPVDPDPATLPLYGSNQRIAMDDAGRVIVIDDDDQAYLLDPDDASATPTPLHFDFQHGDGIDLRCLGIAYDSGQYQGRPGLWTALVTLTFPVAKPTGFTFAEDWTAGGMLTGLTPGVSAPTTIGGTLYGGVWAGDDLMLHLDLWCNDFTATAAQLDSVTWNGTVVWTGTLALPITNSIGVHAQLDVPIDASLTATPFINAVLLGVHVTPGENHFDDAFGAGLSFTPTPANAQTFRTLLAWKEVPFPTDPAATQARLTDGAGLPYWRSGRIVAQPDERWGFVGPPLDLSFFDVTYGLDGTPLTLTTHLSSYQYRLALGPVHRLVAIVDTTFSLEITTGEGHTYGELGINVLPDGTLKLAPFAAQLPNTDVWSGGSDWPLVEFWVKEDGTLFGAPTFAITRVWHYTPEPSIVLGPGCGGTVLLGTQDGEAVIQSHTLLRDNWNDLGYDTLTRSLPYVLNTITGLRVRLQWPMHEYTNYYTMGGMQPYPDFRLNTDLVVTASIGATLRSACGFFSDPATGGDGTYAPTGTVLPVRFNGAGTRVAFSGGGFPIWPGPTAPAWASGSILWPNGQVDAGYSGCCSDAATGVYAIGTEDGRLYYAAAAGSTFTAQTSEPVITPGDTVLVLQLAPQLAGDPGAARRRLVLVHGQAGQVRQTLVTAGPDRTILHSAPWPWPTDCFLTYTDAAHAAYAHTAAATATRGQAG